MNEIELIREKLSITDIRTVRQIIKNKELYNQIVKREVISHKDLIEQYNVANAFVKDLRQKGLISYFDTTGTLNKANRGSKIYYFKDEMEDILSVKIKYYPSIRVRYNLMNKFIIQVAKMCEPERHVQILEMYLVNNLTVEEIADKLYISTERVRQMLNKTSNRTVLDLKRMAEYYPRDRDLMSLRIEREHLKKLNTQLKDKFERNKESRIRADQLSQKHVQHFLQHKLPLELLSQKLPQMEMCDLSIRALNCLSEIEVYTLEDLLQSSEWEITRIRNMGVKTMREIQYWLLDNFMWLMPKK